MEVDPGLLLFYPVDTLPLVGSGFGVSHQGDLHLGHILTSFWRGVHSCPHLRHSSFGKSTLLMPLGYHIGNPPSITNCG